MRCALLLSVVLRATKVLTHGGCLNYTVGETWYPGYSPFDDQVSQDAAPWMVQRKWITNDPIFETTNVSLACNTPGTPARAYIPILPGQSITAVYMYWVHTVGPMIAWMARCANDDCHTFDASTADWFKIGERGLQSETIELGDWFQKTFSRWDGEPSLWSETIPQGLGKGKYLVRHEINSLHSANKPQFYPECAHLEVGGDGTNEPKEEYLARIPGVWSMDQPEINIDIYSPGVSNQTVGLYYTHVDSTEAFQTYRIPGPPVWAGNQ